MRSTNNKLLLSRFFYDNVKFVADMCPKCYEESEDVRIVSINLNFLKQSNVEVYKELTEDYFLGFTEEEVKQSPDCENVSTHLNHTKNSVEKLEMTEEKHNLTVKEETRNITVKEETRNLTVKEESRNISVKEEKRNLTVKDGCKLFQKIDLEGWGNNADKKKTQWRICNKKMMRNNSEQSYYFIDQNLDTEINEITRKASVKDKTKKEHEIYPEIHQRNFLITDFEQEYFEKRKMGNLSKLTQSWVAPKSPHNLIEESVCSDPWALLIATIFLNKTSCATARPYVFWFLIENPDPLAVLDKFPSSLQKYFVNLGLVKTRAVQVYRMSHDYLFKEWTSVRQLYGIGDYGECAYRMFCLGDFSVEPKDRFLKIYKAWHEKFHKQNGYS